MEVKTQMGEECININKIILGKEITVCVQCLNHGVQVTITGGDLSHIGSVSIVDENGTLTTTLFPTHRDNVIGDKWAEKIYDKISMPVVVTAGVHYDNINKNDIENIINETDDMLDEVLGLL
jgi:tagatose-1,6-bisphosphate aldolase non-catalytic subunit AgaZ/GatZ